MRRMIAASPPTSGRRCIAYDGDKIKDGPKSWADFWDVDEVAGQARRLQGCAHHDRNRAHGRWRQERGNLYCAARTPGGFDRAFKKLDELKPHILWAESAADGMQRLLAGDVVMNVNFNARVTGAAKENNRNLVIGWDSGFWVGTDYWVQDRQGPKSAACRRSCWLSIKARDPGRTRQASELWRADTRRL